MCLKCVPSYSRPSILHVNPLPQGRGVFPCCSTIIFDPHVRYDWVRDYLLEDILQQKLWHIWIPREKIQPKAIPYFFVCLRSILIIRIWQCFCALWVACRHIVHVEKPSQRTRRSRQISDLGLPPLPIWAFLKTHWIRDGMVLLCYGPSYQHWLIVKNKSLWDGTFPSSRPNSKTLILIFEKLKCFNGCHFCLVYQSGNSYYAMWSMHMVFCYSS